MATIEEAIYTELTTYSTVVALASTRGYWTNVPYNTTLPAWAYQRIATSRELMHSGPFPIVVVTIQITCQGATYSSAKALAEAIRTRLHGYRGTLSGVVVHRIEVESDQDGEADEDGATVRLDATIQFTEV